MKLPRFLNTLTGRFLMLTVIFVMAVEVVILVPTMARFREDFLLSHLERAQIASLALLANDTLDMELESELLINAGVYNVVLRRDAIRQLVLSSPLPAQVTESFDLRDPSPLELIGDAIIALVRSENHVIRVIGSPVKEAGLLIEVTVESMPLHVAMLEYGKRILLLSFVISLLIAMLLFWAVRVLLVRPIENVVGVMTCYTKAPEDARRIISPSAEVLELYEAETALREMQLELTNALRQKERLAQLGGAVAKVSHDLRNILTTAQLFTDRLEYSNDPVVNRFAPKLVNSIHRAVNLCESTLAFGKAEEPAPRLEVIRIKALIDEVFESERLAIGDYELTFTGDAPTDLVLRADNEQLFRVLSNLVRNARQAIMVTGAEGEISVSVCEGDEDWLLIVKDTGPGLPAKAQEYLFQPFQGGTSKGGFGLGLAIASELIRGHGGQLSLNKSDEAGTEFFIRLPKLIEESGPSAQEILEKIEL